MPTYTLQKYLKDAINNPGRLKVGDWAFEADDALQAQRLAKRALRTAGPSFDFVILWDSHGDSVWEASLPDA